MRLVRLVAGIKYFSISSVLLGAVNNMLKCVIFMIYGLLEEEGRQGGEGEAGTWSVGRV